MMTVEKIDRTIRLLRSRVEQAKADLDIAKHKARKDEADIHEVIKAELALNFAEEDLRTFREDFWSR